MKLIHSEYDLEMQIVENRVNVLVVENPAIMAELVGELYKQCDGAEGRFVLSEDNRILHMNKAVNMITNIFALNCNDKKILTRLYQEIEESATENLFSEGMSVNAAIVAYLEALCEQVSYHVEYQPQIFPTAIMKMADLRFTDESATLLESIVQYLGITNKIFHYGLNIFLNLKMFLPSEELAKLYEYAFYNKIPLLLIEGTVGVHHKEESVILIDVDKCTIKI